MDRKVVRKIQAGLSSWYQANRRDFPLRRTDKHFHILVSEILLHKTPAYRVAPIYVKLVSIYPTPEDLPSASLEVLQDIIRPLGFIHRAERLLAISQKLVRDFNGVIPSDEFILLSLPGIGSYTANAIMCFCFGKQVPIVDINVLRVYRRIFAPVSHSTRLGPDRASLDIARTIFQKREREITTMPARLCCIRLHSP